jgi:activating signal cointegrator 1
MKAISLWQPWASLWAAGSKHYETRHWATRHRGALVIHAAQKLCTDIGGELEQICIDQFGADWAKTLPRGALLATCTLVNCLPSEELRELVSETELAQGNFEDGRFGWGIDDLKLLERPIPFRGHQSIFDVPEHVLGLALPPKRIGELFE